MLILIRSMNTKIQFVYQLRQCCLKCWTPVPVPNALHPVCCHLGLHEEVDYSEKLKFSDDEEEHGDKNKMW